MKSGVRAARLVGILNAMYTAKGIVYVHIDRAELKCKI
jgi:hypothetical protein